MHAVQNPKNRLASASGNGHDTLLEMRATFVHTADWQLGKPFAGVEDVQKRSLLKQERLNVLDRIAEAARAHNAEFVLVAGDVFDSSSATKPVVSAACSAIGRMGLPVFIIPGNHDHGGPGSIWDQNFFKDEARQLAPNLEVLLKPEPLEAGSYVLLPCPLLRRHEPNDPTAWLRSFDLDQFQDKVRIVLAHGSVQGFGADAADDEEIASSAPNQIDLARLPETAVDYIALGDWHGAKKVGSKAWYAGTPELDRFRKGGEYDPGNVLIATAWRNEVPEVKKVCTREFGWQDLAFQVNNDSELSLLEAQIMAITNGQAGQVLLRLELGGSLGIEDTSRLEAMLDAWQARLLKLKLTNSTVVAPSEVEINAMKHRASDPLISRVAGKLIQIAAENSDESVIARIALRELHAVCVQQ